MATNHRINLTAIARLRRLGNSLDRQNFHWPAKAIAAFLAKLDAGEHASLDEAFGLIARKRRGRRPSRESKGYANAKRAILLVLQGMDWYAIEDELGVDAGQLRREIRRHRASVIADLAR